MKLPIPVSALADCGAILGRRGAGKSGTGRDLLEHELEAGHRCCVIDPKGDWYGIRAMADGSPSPYEIPVIGGDHADIPVDDTMGAALGEIVALSKSSFVIDLSGFSVAGMRRFMTAFAEALFFNNRNPITLFVDEADQLCPQRVAAEQAKLLHNMEMLIRQGRQRGIFMWMLTQRPAVINKNVLSQAETLIAMKMTGPQDRKAIREWMDAHDPEKAAMVDKNLSKLNVGEAFAWVPGADFLEKVQFPMFTTYDSGRTPQHGEVVGEIELKALDLGELKALLQGDAADDEDSEAERLLEENRRLRDRNAKLTDENRSLTQQRDAVVAIMTDVQDRIGIVIGSPRMWPAPADADPDEFIMVIDGDGDVRPMTREGVRASRVRLGVRRMRDAVAAEVRGEDMDPERAMVEGEKLLAKMGAAAHTVFETIEPPALKRIITAVASARGAPITRHEIARRCGVSIQSSNMNVRLTRAAGNGLIDQIDQDTFRFVGDKQ